MDKSWGTSFFKFKPLCLISKKLSIKLDFLQFWTRAVFFVAGVNESQGDKELDGEVQHEYTRCDDIEIEANSNGPGDIGYSIEMFWVLANIIWKV